MENTALLTFEIQTGDFRAFTFEFAKLAKKAAKLGVAAPTFTILNDEKVYPAEYAQSGQLIRPGRVVKVIEVSGQAPKIAGWNFIATLQHEEAGNIVRRVPNTEKFAVGFDLRSAKPFCNHCNTLRRRNDTYVVANDEGRTLQVGRNCLKDFTGHDSPEAIARWAELLSAFEESHRDGGEGGLGGSGENHSDLVSYLAYTVLFIREIGWMSRTKAREFGNVTATADSAWSHRFPSDKLRRDYSNAGLPFPTPTDADVEKAKKSIEVAESFFESEEAAGRVLEDYTHNLRIVIECNSVSFRSAGLAASVVAFADRQLGIAVERKQAAESQHVGEIGKRETFLLTVSRITDIDGNYGTTHLHIFKDEKGNVFKWFASNERLDVGVAYRVKGTVKAHEDYKNTRQTVLSRCSINEPEKAPKVKKPRKAKGEVVSEDSSK